MTRSINMKQLWPCNILMLLLAFLSLSQAADDIIGPANTEVKYDIRSALVLNCKIGDKQKSTTIEWYKEDVLVKEVPLLKDRYKTIEVENKFIIDRTVEGDAGQYGCKLSKNNVLDADYAYTYEVIAKPAVKLAQSTSVVEGEKLKIVCVVVGKPTPVVSWRIGNETYNSSASRIVLQPHPDSGVENAVLVIESAEMSDRGDYTCTAENTEIQITVEDTTLVRVKDKLAALWPFLGICAEVFVLCAIILIYEKKRNKTEMEESDTDQSPDQKK